MNIGTNVLGQAVPTDNISTLAIGMYFLDPEHSPVNCGALQPIAVVAHHGVDENGEATGVLYGCNGTTTQVHEPDVYLVDDSWKPWITYSMILGVVLIGAALIKKAL